MHCCGGIFNSLVAGMNDCWKHTPYWYARVRACQYGVCN